ncbi:MAG: glycosyl hydrolase 2 galactose-binding domain-containing protein, partial [Ignavibacteria bacterium]
MKRFDLISGWKFNVGDENPSLINLNEWLPAKIPGTVHTDLLENKIIAEPFFDDNELKIGWVCESDWIYKTTFSRPSDFNSGLPVFLVFEGIDTIAEIYLNNSLLGNSVNMFLKYEFEVTSLLKETNELV